jgi:hypothetical protein
MSNFIFNWAVAALSAATLDLSTGNYYAHLVTTAPALGHATVADLVLPAVSGYTSTPLIGLNYNANRWTFDSFNFPKYAFASTPSGVVICKRTGVNPANTDGIICYSDFNNSIGQTINLQAGAYVINLQFGSNGAINFSYRYLYSSGSWDSLSVVPKGIVYLVMSNNNTVPRVQSYTKIVPTFANCFDGNLSTSQNYQSCLGMDFVANTIQVGEIGLWLNTPVANQVKVWGSNNPIIVIDTPTMFNNSNWTEMASFPSLVSGLNLLAINNPNYWRFLKVQDTVLSLSLSPQEIEFYNSKILSPTANLV